MKPITRFTQLFIGTLILTSSLFAHSNEQMQSSVQVKEITIPLSGSEIKNHALGPKRGDSMMQVEAKYGKAIKVHPTTGTPPITRWDYPEFSVYFESRFVIHTVNRNN